MGTFLGHYRANAGYMNARGEASRADGSGLVDDAMRDRVVSFREKMPEGINLVGAYAPLSTDTSAGGVMIVETDDPVRLAAINDHYYGFLDFTWQPVNPMGTSTTEASEGIGRMTTD